MFEPGQNYRLPNKEYRSREHLTFDEVQRLVRVAELRGRHPIRDKAVILLSFRHGLRAGEASTLRWDAVMLDRKTIYIQRLKGSVSGVHPLQPDEVELLQDLRQQYPKSHYLFVNERGEHLSTGAIAKIVKRCGELAELPMGCHPHQLRHACGFYLADMGTPTNDIQAYLGHRNISNTVIYTGSSAARFSKIQWESVG